MTTDKAQKVRHTPVPWTYHKPTGSRWHIGSKDGSHLVIGKINDDNTHTLGEANAAFICQAANSFEKLLEAAKGLLSEVEPVIKGGAPAILNGGSAYLRIAFNSLQLIVREAEGRP